MRARAYVRVLLRYARTTFHTSESQSHIPLSCERLFITNFLLVQSHFLIFHSLKVFLIKSNIKHVPVIGPLDRIRVGTAGPTGVPCARNAETFDTYGTATRTT